jgi:hypothetical protein
MGYWTSIGAYGFYRGYTNLVKGNDFGKRHTLTTDRVLSGLGRSVQHFNPFIQPFVLTCLMRRIEKRVRNIEVTGEDYNDGIF